VKPNLTILCSFLALACAPIFGLSHLAVVEPANAPAIFPGKNQLAIAWTNCAAERVSVEVKGRWFQMSSALGMPLPLEVTQKIEIAPNQTALKPITIDAPEVRARSSFLIQWRDADDQGLGTTKMTVYPRDILRELESIAGGQPPGVVDGRGMFLRAFKAAKIEAHEMRPQETGGFRGKLLIVADADRSASTGSLIAVAAQGAIVISIAPPLMDEKQPLRPNFYGRAHGKGMLIFVQESFLESFDTNAEAQLRLVEICRMAAKPGAPDFPMILSKGSE
jgi:hypothetical protein